MQHLPDTASGALPGGGGLEGVQCFGSWQSLLQGCVCVCVCMCVHTRVLFHGAHLFSDAHVGLFGSPLGKEKVQNAMTPDGKYYALVNEADVSPLTLGL